MKVFNNLMATMVLLFVLLFSCMNKEDKSAIDERTEENHPKKSDNKQTENEDTLRVVKDSLIDQNMKDQDDTHGRDTDAGN